MIHMFMLPSILRKVAETDVPTMPPILVNTLNLKPMAETVTATTPHAITTILVEKSDLAR